VHRECGGLRDKGAFKFWLYQIATRACIDRARSRKRAGTSVPIYEELPEDKPADDPEGSALRKADVRTIWQALGALPARQGLVLYLRQVEGRSYKELATLVGCSEAAIETLLFRARQSFARSYGRLESDRGERCQLSHQVMAAVMDHEASELQQRALNVHLDECPTCRRELGGMEKAAAGYAALPMLPFTKSLLSITAASGAATAASGGLGAGLWQMTGLCLLKAKASLVPLLVAGGLATSTVGGSALVFDEAGWWQPDGAALEAQELAVESLPPEPPAAAIEQSLRGLLVSQAATPRASRPGTASGASASTSAGAAAISTPAAPRASLPVVPGSTPTAPLPPSQQSGGSPSQLVEDVLPGVVLPQVEGVVDALGLPLSLPTFALPLEVPPVELPVQLPQVTLPLEPPVVEVPVTLPPVTLPLELPPVELQLAPIELPLSVPELPLVLPTVELPVELPELPPVVVPTLSVPLPTIVVPALPTVALPPLLPPTQTPPPTPSPTPSSTPAPKPTSTPILPGLPSLPF
jgi:RNA polymerase sigma factor (sigma-70 family)